VTRLISIVVLLIVLRGAVNAQQGVTLDDHRVTLTEFGAWIKLPDHWSAATVPADSGSEFEREELTELRTSKREWRQQYAEIFNSFLPFETLAFQAGEKAWKGDGTVSQPFMRVYIASLHPRKCGGGSMMWGRKRSSGVERAAAAPFLHF
jgi:hypothetical protein